MTRRHETVFFDSAKDAVSKDMEQSPNYSSLNGVWDFRYYDSVQDMLADPDKAPTAIKVPGNWEVQGFGTAVYVNHPYEFCPRNPQPPQLPDKIPTGVYSRKFTPEFGAGEKCYLNLCGVKGGVYLFINDNYVGYSEDSKDLVRYDITPYVESGMEADLRIVVTRWNTGSYLECQDFWRISGIERDVYLSREPAAVPEDFDWNVVSTLADDLSTGDFRLSVNSSKPINVSWTLLDAKGNETAKGATETVQGVKQWQSAIKDVRRWSAETPELYTLLLCVEGKHAKANVGFRRLEIVGDRFLVNGMPVKFKGVNIHEHNQFTGHYITEEDMLTDLRLMKNTTSTPSAPATILCLGSSTNFATSTDSMSMTRPISSPTGWVIILRKPSATILTGCLSTGTESSICTTGPATTRASRSSLWATRPATAATSTTPTGN